MKKRLVKKILKNPERYTKQQVIRAKAHLDKHKEESSFCICFYCEKFHRKDFVCEEHKRVASEELFYDVQEERRMNGRVHHLLPSGDVEYADEYGGY